MSEDTISPDRLHNLLASRRRRYVLYCLYLYADPMGLSDVAGQIAEWENEAPEDELLDERRDILTSLHHNHIAKLADADMVTYSESEDMVELDDNAAHIRPYLELTVASDLESTEISTL